jgi:DNA-binding NarL/FixJ family response regulator
MPGLNGIEATRQIRHCSLETRVLILSMRASVHYVYEAFDAGADGYVVKQSAGTDLVDALRLVHRGQRYVTATFAGAVLEDFVHRRGAFDGPLRDLTARERQVLRLVVEGKSSAEAGRLLKLTRRTVETYRARMMQKLGLSDLPSLVKFAIRHGLTSVD